MLIKTEHTHKKIAIVELGGSHDECLLSQFYALKQAGCITYFISTYDLWERNQELQKIVDHFYLIEFNKKSFADFLRLRALNRYFCNQNISKVIFNTAQGAHVRNLCLLAAKKIEYIGLIHTSKKFTESFTQKIIHRKIKKYFVLNDFFLEKITPPKGIEVRSFYPLRFPAFSIEIPKPEGEIWIVIIGGVESRRKDLIGSIELMKTILHRNIQFIFLGKADPNDGFIKEFKSSTLKVGLASKIVLFDSFLTEDIFDAYLKKADFIWPMVHPETPSAKEYFKNQISGAMNISFAYHIPMLVHELYSKTWLDLKYSFSYNLSSFAVDFDFASENRQKLVDQLKSEEKFNPEFQEAAYLDFLFQDENI